MRRGLAKRRKKDPNQTSGDELPSNNHVDDDDASKRRGAPRSSLGTVISSAFQRGRVESSSSSRARPSRKCSLRKTIASVVILVLALLLFWYKADALGLLVDDVLLYLVHRLGHAPALPKDVAGSIVHKWPTVELRNRKSIQDYRNTYLEAVLGNRDFSSYSYSSSITQQHSDDEDNYFQTTELVVSEGAQLFWKDWWAKFSLQERLTRVNCRPGWWCHQCLYFPLAGALSKCQSVCPACYARVLRDDAIDEAKNGMPLLRSLPTKWQNNDARHQGHGQRNVHSKKNAAIRIPRIIHHVGSFQELPTMFSHPEWIRAQNTWRVQSQYQYHMYPTIDSQRRWIARYYPSFFVDAFDFLNNNGHGRRELDLFALLVLFRKGGVVAYSKKSVSLSLGNQCFSDLLTIICASRVFAAVDLLLEVQLNTLLLDKSVSFVAAVDSRSALSSQPFSSLYPGLIVARAGHSVVGRAIEALMYTVAIEMQYTSLQRQYQERLALFARSFDIPSLEIWRTTKLTTKAFSPLAFSVHQALRHASPFSPIETGVVSMNDNGKALFLLVSLRIRRGSFHGKMTMYWTHPLSSYPR